MNYFIVDGFAKYLLQMLYKFWRSELAVFGETNLPEV